MNYGHLPYQRRNPQGGRAQGQTKEINTAQGALLRGLTSEFIMRPQWKVAAERLNLLIFEHCLAETREESIIRPDIFASHRTVLLRRAKNTCARFFPAQIKTFVEVTAIFQIRVFSEQRRIPFEILALVDIELGRSLRRCFKSGRRASLKSGPYLHFRRVRESKKTLGRSERPGYRRGWDSMAFDCKCCLMKDTSRKEVAHWIRTIKETDVD
jgi:hypothetical protein